MNQPFLKDLSDVTWDEVYARQKLRDDLVPAWLDALALKPGDRVLDVGSGPGRVSLALADRVGPDGVVYAIDRSAGALAYLERLQRERGIAHIRRLVADIATLEDIDIRANSALVTMVLHHADDPLGILSKLPRLLSPRAPIIVAEFDPEGPGEQGPPRTVRLAPAQVQAWCEAAGILVREFRRQTLEHYMLVAENAI